MDNTEIKKRNRPKKDKKRKKNINSTIKQNFELDNKGGDNISFFIDTDPTLESNNKSIGLGLDLSLIKNRKNNNNSEVLGREINDLEITERNLTDDLFGDCTQLNNDTGTTNQGFIYSQAKYEEEQDDTVLSEETFSNNKRKAVWLDEEDESIKVKDVVASYSKARGTRGIRETSDAKYEDSLKDKFTEVFGDTPQWAQLDRTKEEDSDIEDDMTKKTSIYLAPNKSLQNLSKGSLKFKIIHDLNQDSYKEGSLINAIDFDADMNIALVAGSSGNNFGSATLFQLDGKKNYKIKNVTFPKYPIKCAKFMLKKRQFVAGSNLYGRFYVYDIEEGKKIDIPCVKANDSHSGKKFEVSPDGNYIAFIGRSGEIKFFDCVSFCLCQTLKVPCEVNAITFSPDANILYTFGDNGQVYIFDLVNWRCVHSFYDDGCLEGTAIAASPDGSYLACGSSSGVVNVYERTAVISSQSPAPLKAIGSLVTPVTSMAFNPTSEILAISSSYKENAIKLVHTGSLSVFSNFPGGFAVRRIQTVAFSPDGKYLAGGTNHGMAHLWRLFHY